MNATPTLPRRGIGRRPDRGAYLRLTGTACVGLLTAALFWPLGVSSHETVDTTVTFEAEISRILIKKCISCHTPNNLAFPLTTYEETRPWARAIEEEVLRRHMPPWRAVAGYGQFANDAGLTTRERQLLLAWIEGNGPKNSTQRLIVNIDQMETAEADRLHLHTDSWELDEPDATLTLPAVTLDARAPDQVREVEVETGFRNDRWVGSIEFRPSDRRLVRAAFFSIKETGEWLGSWTPWYGMTALPNDTARMVPAGAHVVVELHLRGTNESADEHGTLGLNFRPKTPARCVADLTLATDAGGSSTPKGTRFEAFTTLKQDVSLLAVRPLLPPDATSLELIAQQPDGRVTVLLFVRHMLPEWPTPYIYKRPKALSAGTRLSMVSYAGTQASAADASSEAQVQLMTARAGFKSCAE